VCALLFSYAISIGCMALKRIRREPLLPSSFSLGRMGLFLNVFSVVFLLFTFVMVSYALSDDLIRVVLADSENVADILPNRPAPNRGADELEHLGVWRRSDVQRWLLPGGWAAPLCGTCYLRP
jgi:hypothetical protein